MRQHHVAQKCGVRTSGRLYKMGFILFGGSDCRKAKINISV